MDNIICAFLGHDKRCRTTPLYRYDTGMKLKLTGIDLPHSFRVDFSNSINSKSKPMLGTDGLVSIPAEYFVPGETIYAWVVLPNDDGRNTVYQVSIPISPRAEPTDVEPLPEEQSYIDQVIAALNEAVDDAQQAIMHYPKIVNNMWFVWDVTDEQYVSTGIVAEGEDGYSPTVTVSLITGGYRLTITDVNGDHVFNVMDGAPGLPGQDGVSPYAVIISIPGGHRISIVDINGSQTFDIMDGKDGINGISPNASVTKSGNTATITITDVSGTTTAQITDGTDGTDGKDGVTFTPTVSQQGIISWTNDGSLPNPESVDIKGPTGDSGVYVGTEEPTNPDVNIWINPNGSGSVLDQYAMKTDTVLDTTLSRGRKAETTVGDGSFAFGYNVEASGYGSFAKGYSTKASGAYSSAEGYENIASGAFSHAEGGYQYGKTTASGQSSHAEGLKTTASGYASHAEGYCSKAQNYYTHAEGYYSIANGYASHSSGKYNVEDSYASWPEWEPGEYAIGDKCKVTTIVDNEATVTGYICKTANNDATFDVSHWTKDVYMNYAEIIGNGTANNARSNARALDWDGNEHLMGDVYVGCNPDSTGGTKLAKITDIPATDIQIDGTSIINNNIANIPKATESGLGVVKVSPGNGLKMNEQGAILISAADSSDVKLGTASQKPIVPSYQHMAAFYGLAKAAGSDEKNSVLPAGQYTETAKSKISNMLNAPVSVSGTTPIITAMAGVQYVCGEVSTLAITIPESGCFDVVFESGSTATVLTFTLPTGYTLEWANGFDDTSLDADTTYEINIKVVGMKCLGVAGSWT